MHPQDIDAAKISAVIRTAEAFSKILYPCIIVLDYATGDFLHTSGNFNSLCGTNADDVHSMGFAFYKKMMAAEDFDMLKKARPLWRKFISNLPIDKRMDYSMHCDFHIMNGVKAFLVHHVFTTIDLGADDLPHLVLCTMSITTKNQSGNIEMRGTNGTHYYVLDVMHNIWHKRRDIVLSWQERDVLVLSFRGLSVTEIAQIMCKSVDATKTCKQKMFKRMGVKNIVEAAAYATNYRLI